MRISDWSSDVCSSDLRGTRDRILASVRRQDHAMIAEQFGKAVGNAAFLGAGNRMRGDKPWRQAAADSCHIAQYRLLGAADVADDRTGLQRAHATAECFGRIDRKSTRLNSSH